MNEKVSQLELQVLKNFQLQAENAQLKYQAGVLDLYLRYRLSPDDKVDFTTGEVTRKENLIPQG